VRRKQGGGKIPRGEMQEGAKTTTTWSRGKLNKDILLPYFTIVLASGLTRVSIYGTSFSSISPINSYCITLYR